MKENIKTNDGIVWLPIDSLFPHPDNPRKDVGDVTELADSIKAKGIMQNLTVVPFKSRTNPNFNGAGRYTVIIGHRRMAAAQLAGLTELPCVIVEMTEQEQLETMLLENMQRVDLTAYEQAQGFQLMMNFGDSIEEVSAKTGFSPTTIRRRVKLLELDQDKLKNVSEKQISIADLDKLSKIDDLDVRNKVLETIGTNNFDSRFESALNEQNIKKAIPLAKKLVKKLKAKKISRSETYGGKYNSIGKSISLKSWDGEAVPVKADETRKLFYYLDESWGTLAFYVEAPKAKPVRRSAEEIAREKLIDETWTALHEKTALYYKLRSDFVKSITLNTKNSSKVLRGAVLGATLSDITLIQRGLVDCVSVLGMEQTYTPEETEKTLKAVWDADADIIPQLIYVAFGDGENKGYIGGYRREFPHHNNNDVLNYLYKWLCSLGYEMSDEEIALQDGSHELFKLGEKEGGSV